MSPSAPWGSFQHLCSRISGPYFPRPLTIMHLGRFPDTQFMAFFLFCHTHFIQALQIRAGCRGIVSFPTLRLLCLTVPKRWQPVKATFKQAATLLMTVRSLGNPTSSTTDYAFQGVPCCFLWKGQGVLWISLFFSLLPSFLSLFFFFLSFKFYLFVRA